MQENSNESWLQFYQQIRNFEGNSIALWVILSRNKPLKKLVIEGNASMDYRRTLRKASEVISTMRELMGEEELALMDSKAKGYVRLMERSIDEPFNKFIIDRINGFSFK